MGLFQYILQGFGCRFGTRAADAALEELENMQPAPAETARARRARERREARARRRAARKHAAARARDRKEVDRELDRLKQRVSGKG